LDSPIKVIIKKKGDEVYSIGSDATIFEALTLMAEKHIGALVVMDGSDLKGIFSERDYARKVVLAGRSSREMKVREIMSEKVITVGSQSTVSECMQHMTDRHCRHLPVVEEGKVVALVSLGDLVNWIISAQDRTIHDLEDFISGDYPV
jgi:CBS domain-containing protein